MWKYAQLPVASIIQLNLRRCTISMKNPPAHRPLWASTQKFRVRRIVDLCLQFCQEERERGAAAGWEEGGGRETAVPTRRYEGMDLDLKGGITWKEGVEGSEVGWAISEPSVAQWLTGAIQPTASTLPFFSPFFPSSSSHRPPMIPICVLMCLTQLARETDTRYP